MAEKLADYVLEWAGRALKFNARLAVLGGELELRSEVSPPRSKAKRKQLEKELVRPIPAPLREILAQTDGIHARWVWTPAHPVPEMRSLFSATYLYGGGSLFVADSFAESLRDCQESVEDSCLADSEEDAAWWKTSFPFLRMNNGDYLALSADCQVVYLSHDDESKPIARNLQEFLAAWEKVCYVGPEIWMLKPFLDAKSGFLKVGRVQQQQVAQIFKRSVQKGR